MLGDPWRFVALVLPTLLGALAAASPLIKHPHEFVKHLNLYAFYIAFPALVAHALATSTLALPDEPWFYALWPVALLLLLGAIALKRLAIRWHIDAPLALCAIFGNIAYIGLPYARIVLGDALLGAASALVAIHISGAVILGPLLLTLYGGQHEIGWRRVLARVGAQPLVWAPLLGLLIRSLPEPAHDGVGLLIAPIGASAAPVALCMIGAYLYASRDAIRYIDRASLSLLITRLLIAPALVLALATLGTFLGWLPGELAALHVIIAATPRGRGRLLYGDGRTQPARARRHRHRLVDLPLSDHPAPVDRARQRPLSPLTPCSKLLPLPLDT